MGASSSGPGPISPGELLDRARKIDSLQGALLAGITTIILAIATGITNFINAVSNFFSAPVFELGDQGANVVAAFVGGIAAIITRGAAVTAAELGASNPLVIGLLSFMYAIAVAGGGAWVMALILQRSGTSDAVLGLMTNFPLVGTSEDDPEES